MINNDQIILEWRNELWKRISKIKRLSRKYLWAFELWVWTSLKEFSIFLPFVVWFLLIFKLKSFWLFLNINPIANELRVLILFIDSFHLHLLNSFSSFIRSVWLFNKCWVQHIDDLFFSLSKYQNSFLKWSCSWVTRRTSEQILSLWAVYWWRIICN